jgi:hypothetical protein
VSTKTQAEAYDAIRNWCEGRAGSSKSPKLQISAPISETLDIDQALCLWRARCVDEAIGKLAPTRFFKAILTDLLWHAFGDSRDLEGFRGIPRGQDGAGMLQSQIDLVVDTVANILEAGGRPSQATFEEAGVIPKVVPETAIGA